MEHISHSTYKIARLFQRPEGNLALKYAETNIRPNLGTKQMYNLTKGDENGREEKREDDKGKKEEQKEGFTVLFASFVCVRVCLCELCVCLPVEGLEAMLVAKRIV